MAGALQWVTVTANEAEDCYAKGSMHLEAHYGTWYAVAKFIDWKLAASQQQLAETSTATSTRNVQIR
jgi:hypothetical protein